MSNSTIRGLAYGAGAFAFWGLAPVYWKTIQHVPATETLAHRIVWSFPLVVLTLTVLGRWHEVRAALGDMRERIRLTASTILISINWFGFVWAVNNDHVLDASLGYFINPLVNVLLGGVFLRERLSRRQAIAVLLAAAGVTLLIVRVGRVPWIAFALAGSFGLYGLVRKVMRTDAIAGLGVELAVLFGPALAYLVWAGRAAGGAFTLSRPGEAAILASTGAFTVAPLVAFTLGARRLRYTTLGLLQYLTPTCHFVLAVFIYGEPFTGSHLAAFALIWSGLALYTSDAFRRRP